MSRNGTIALYISFWLAILVVFVGIPTEFQSFNEHNEIITVTDKERVNTRNDSYCLVFGEDDLGNTVVYKNDGDGEIGGAERWQGRLMETNCWALSDCSTPM